MFTWFVFINTKVKKQVMGDEVLLQLSAYWKQKTKQKKTLSLVAFFLVLGFTGMATILYECRLGCLENKIPQETQDYISALHLMFSSFKTTMYAGAIPKWLRPVIPKPWEEFCLSWDGLFKFSMWFAASQIWPQDAINIFFSVVVFCVCVPVNCPHAATTVFPKGVSVLNWTQNS